MNNVALIIIYNHHYIKNIGVLEKIYGSRFSNIFHLVPFYKGNRSNVIPVYENSYYFQGYIAQSYNILKNKFKHYFFIADDLIINPLINEGNYTEKLKLTEDTCFLPSFIQFNNTVSGWNRVEEAVKWTLQTPGVEIDKHLPDYDSALYKLKKLKLDIHPLKFNQIWNTPSGSRGWIRLFVKENRFVRTYMKSLMSHNMYQLSYPLVGGYSDIFVINSAVFKKFSHYCGLFAAANLFVEIAIPTSIALCAEKVITEGQIEYRGKALWSKQELSELDKFDRSLRKLLIQFPEHYLYLHPVKLSVWNNDLE